jgi:hypothetical protein
VSSGRAAVYLAAASLLNYLAWLGWDRERDRHPDGSLTGPYEPWQVVGLIAVMATLAVVAGWNRRAILATIIVSIVTWLAWTINAASSDNSGLWAVGSAMVLAASLGGTAVVSALAGRVARVVRHPRWP